VDVGMAQQSCCWYLDSTIGIVHHGCGFVFCLKLWLLSAVLLQTVTGYRLEVVTVRKLEFETDAFAFADKVRKLTSQRSMSNLMPCQSTKTTLQRFTTM